MKIKQTVNTQIMSRLAMHDPKDHLARMKLHFDMLPSMTPNKWDYGEPFKKPYDKDSDWQEIYQWKGSSPNTIYWKRLKDTRAWGCFNIALEHRGWDWDTHASEVIDSELAQTNFVELIAYVKASSVQFKADLAFIDHWHDAYKAVNRYNYLVTRELRHCLDDVYWVTVFGEAYVRLFGMEKLLSVPAYKVEQLNDETVFIQLTENLTDSSDDFAEFQRLRKAVRDHLDPDAFYQEEKSYPFRSGDPDSSKIQTKQWVKGQLPDRGEVFNAPLFNLIPDDYMDRKPKIYSKQD